MQYLRIFGSLIIALALLSAFRASAEDAPLPTCEPDRLGQIYPSPDVVHDNTLFAAGEWASNGYIRHLYKSVDRGLTWQALPELPLTEEWAAEIDFSPDYANDRTLSVSFISGTNISSDGGLTWRVVSFPRSAPNAFALGSQGHLYAGYGQEIPPDRAVPMELQVSTDGGVSWQVTYQGLEVLEIAISPAFATDQTLALALGLYHYNGGIVKSTDAGFSWTNANEGLDRSGFGIESLRFSPQFAVDRTLFCYNSSTEDSGLYKSINAGESWTYLPGTKTLPYIDKPNIVVSPLYPVDQTLWYVTGSKGLTSHDGGQNWQQLLQPLRLMSAAEYCSLEGVCGVELFGERLERGETWEQNKYYLYRSYDYGRTWQCLDDPTPPGANPNPTPPPAEIPEPGTWALLGGGVAGLTAYLARRGKS